MEQKLDNKILLKDKLISIYNGNKNKIYSLIGILFSIFVILIILNINSQKKNKLISEKYIQAGIYLSQNNIKSKALYEEIILSKNKFYSILALNTILEKDLELDKKKILNYFEIIEKSNKSEEQTDLILFKKALYLIKISYTKEGNKLLRDLIDKNSELKFLAEEIISK
jgi:hypothetical protein